MVFLLFALLCLWLPSSYAERSECQTEIKEIRKELEGFKTAVEEGKLNFENSITSAVSKSLKDLPLIPLIPGNLWVQGSLDNPKWHCNI